MRWLYGVLIVGLFVPPCAAAQKKAAPKTSPKSTWLHGFVRARNAAAIQGETTAEMWDSAASKKG